jgi:recombination protein RecR
MVINANIETISHNHIQKCTAVYKSHHRIAYDSTMTDIRTHLTELFRVLPGIGTKQSERFVTAVLERGPAYASDMAQTLLKLHSNVHLCRISYQYFETEDTSETLSPLVRDTMRDNTLLMIVEKDTDIASMERSKSYNGQYFVLGGLVPMLQTRTKHAIRINELLVSIESRLQNNSLSEVILGFSFTPEGDHTRLYIETKLTTLIESLGKTISLSSLGRGMAVGSEIEYSDPSTLSYALQHRMQK